MTRTFIDSGVLIGAARGTDAVSGKARAVLTDANRQFIASDLVRLEVLPKRRISSERRKSRFIRHSSVLSRIGWRSLRL